MEKWRSLVLLLPFLTSSWGQETWMGTCSFRRRVSSNFDVNSNNTKDIIEGCKACATIWQQFENGTLEVLEQGCFPDPEQCRSKRCVDDERLKQILDFSKSEHVCCCIGSLCNQEFRPNYMEWDVTDIIVPFFIVLLFLLVGILIGLLCKIFRGSHFGSSHDLENKLEGDKPLLPITSNTTVVKEESEIKENGSESPSVKADLIDLEGFEILDSIYQGQFSTICKVSRKNMRTNMVWKQYKDKQKFYNERDVYEKLIVAADNSVFLQCFGSHDGAVNGDSNSHSRIICLELASGGSLASHLKTSTLSWPQLCAMLVDISKGLSKLHNTYKIVHRKVCSTNILVRDLNHCCIGDFSHAVFYENLANYSLGASTTSGIIFNDPENIRYQAPELLDEDDEGFLNVSWTQADIYALGLLFWEMSLRCHELYQGVGVPPFQLAFEKEIGMMPSKEQMKIMVSRNKARPLFPEVWKNSNPAIQQLKETINDSWDDDGEARLTASCIVERVRELDHLWDRYKLVSAGPPILDLAQPNNTQPRQEAKKTSYYPNLLSTSELATKLKNDNICSGQKPLIKIQPHQGLNPCLERNFVSNIEKENSLESYVVGSLKDKPKAKPKTDFATSLNERQVTPTRSRPHVAHPIPHLRNDIQGSHNKTKNQQRRPMKNLRANEKSTF